jgi:branched-chain amino acid transport system substrate-binding protein
MPKRSWFRRGRLVPTLCGFTVAVLVAVTLAGNVDASGTGLGTPQPAREASVTIGMITDAGGGANGTAGLVEAGAKMAVAYANAYAKGLDGHKLVLYICENQNTPAGGQTCANDMVKKGVVAVVEPFTGQGATEVPTITKAGIPYITLSGASEAELTTPGAFDLTGGFPAVLGGIALQAKSKGYKKVDFLVENVPAAIQGAQVLGAMVFKAAGVGFEVTPVDVGTADMTPQLQSATSGGADAVGMVGDVTFCSSFLQAYNTLDLKLPRYVLSTCQDPSILDSASLDKALAGSYTTTTTAASKGDLATYSAIIKKYLPKVSPNPSVSSNQASGVTPILTLAAIMKGSTQPVTAAGVRTQTEAAKNVVLPLSGGLTFTCNGTAIPLLKSVCSSAAAIGIIQSGKAGKVTGIKVYNPTPLF